MRTQMALDACILEREPVQSLRLMDVASQRAEPSPYDPLDPMIGQLIDGRYWVKSKLGEGGMGRVWLARQQEPIRREVALKIVKSGYNSKEMLARFEIERQSLELMEHPAIVADMEQWNAMPYVSGLLPQYEILGKGEPPLTLEGWKGLRVRAGGGLGRARRVGHADILRTARERGRGCECECECTTNAHGRACGFWRGAVAQGREAVARRGRGPRRVARAARGRGHGGGGRAGAARGRQAAF